MNFSTKIIIGIEATNIRGGGGVTHLRELLNHLNINTFQISKIIVFAGQNTLDSLPNHSWIKKVTHPFLNKSLIHRIIWQLFYRDKAIQEAGCDILFSPGGMYQGKFRPFVGMSQNMLLYDRVESSRYKFEWNRFRIGILSRLQRKSFEDAQGLMFISQFAQKVITRQLPQVAHKKIKVVHHGINSRFELSPRLQKSISAFSHEKPFHLLYVSSIDVYKHQWKLIEAVAELRRQGYPVVLDIIGEALHGPSVRLMKKAIKKHDPQQAFVRWQGGVPFEQIQKHYHTADMFVYSSTCENMPNIVIEAMSSGLPIASSDFQPMPEFLQDACVYYNPLSVESTASAIKEMLDNPQLRTEKALKAYEYAQRYSWTQCANETFEYLSAFVLSSAELTQSAAAPAPVPLKLKTNQPKPVFD